MCTNCERALPRRRPESRGSKRSENILCLHIFIVHRNRYFTNNCYCRTRAACRLTHYNPPMDHTNITLQFVRTVPTYTLRLFFIGRPCNEYSECKSSKHSVDSRPSGFRAVIYNYMYYIHRRIRKYFYSDTAMVLTRTSIRNMSWTCVSICVPAVVHGPNGFLYISISRRAASVTNLLPSVTKELFGRRKNRFRLSPFPAL